MFVFQNICFCVSWFCVSVLVYYAVSSVFYVVSLMFGACGVFWCCLFGMPFPYYLCCCVSLFCVDASGVVCVCICIVCFWFVSLFLKSDAVGACTSIVCLL